MSLPTSTSASTSTVASAVSGLIGDLAGYRPPASGGAAATTTPAANGAGNADATSSLSDWSWLSQSLPAASLSLEGLEPPGASGGSGLINTSNLNSGGGIKYDQYGSNPYQVCAHTHVHMPSAPACVDSFSP